MRDDWEIKTLEHSFMKDSSNLSINKLKDNEGDYPFYSAKGFVKNISFYHQEKSYLAIIKDGAGVGRVSLHPAKSSVVGTLQYLLPKEGFDLKFLYYYLLSVDFSKYFTGSTIPHIYFKDYKSEPFPVVALDEQKAIVEILDQAFESIEKAKANIEKNIENAKELFQSKLNQIFSTDSKGWESKTLKQISVDFGRGKSKHRPRNDKKLYNGEYPFIQTGDVRQSDKLIISYSKSYNEVGLAQSKLWPKNTICITIAANIAESAILDFDACFPDSIIGVVVDSKTANQKFLYYSLQFFKQDLKKLGKGSAQDNINLGTFENHFFNFPNTTKQKEIVETLDIVDNHIQSLMSSYDEELKNLEELKKSILQKAFSGELTNKSFAA